MPTSIWGVALYVFALFPGIAFIFAREGHRPVSKQSALRETATVVFVSAICAAVLSLAVAGVAVFWPEFRATVRGLLRGDLTWALENWPTAILLATVSLILSTLLGRFMGSKWAFEKGLKRIWESDIPRDTSSWTQLFTADTDGKVVEVALNLKSGAWVSGLLYSFDNDPEPHPHRTITLTIPTYRAPGSTEAAVPLDGTDYLVIEACEIELLQTSTKLIEQQPAPPEEPPS